MDRAGLSRWARRWQIRFPGLAGGGLCVVVALAAAAAPGPPPVADDLSSVDAVSPASVWAVGDLMNHRRGPTLKTLVLHWNGTKWARIASPNPSRQWNLLSGVSVISRNDAWAVGNSAKGSDASQNLILHWNGTNWARS